MKFCEALSHILDKPGVVIYSYMDLGPRAFMYYNGVQLMTSYSFDELIENTISGVIIRLKNTSDDWIVGYPEHKYKIQTTCDSGRKPPYLNYWDIIHTQTGKKYMIEFHYDMIGKEIFPLHGKEIDYITPGFIYLSPDDLAKFKATEICKDTK